MTEHSEQAHNPGNTDRDTVDDDRREDTPGKPDPQEATLLEQMGGVSGLFYSSIPVVVFVAVNAMFGLMPAIWSALGSAVVITVVWSGLGSLVLLYVVRAITGLRVPEELEREGLDLASHGERAYAS